MPRRSTYSRVERSGRVRTARANRNGNRLYRGFECLRPECDQYIVETDETLSGDYRVSCKKCDYIHTPTGEQKLFDYELVVTEDDEDITLETGFFTVSHREYVEEAQRIKFCVLCNKLKPVEFFDLHASRPSGRQGECNLCKRRYNTIKNKTRIADQHREAANRRRLFLDVAEECELDVSAIRQRFNNQCFNCGLDLSDGSGNRFHLDHTLPVYYLWPLTTNNATLLCSECNGKKANKWPCEFYDDAKVRALSVKTGIGYRLLSGHPKFNEDAVNRLREAGAVERLLAKYARYEDEVFRLRNRLSEGAGIDIFYGVGLNEDIIIRADEVDANEPKSGFSHA